MKSKKHTPIKRFLTVIIAAALFTCLIAFYAPGSLAAEQSVIRVKLSAGSVTSFNFSLCGNYGIKGEETSLNSGSYTVKAESNKLKLYRGSDVLFTGADITIEEYAPEAGTYNYATLSTSKYGTNKYRGSLQFKLNSGKIDVINHIYLEYYLYGVVPHEMSNSWPIEALKTQAVAARTYAKRYMTGSGSYDVVDTSTHQVYKGYNAANGNAIRAVDETAKTVLKCGAELVQTYYAASNGGYVDIPQHLWSASAPVKPYHVLQPDPYDTQNTWSAQEVLIFPKTMQDSAIQYKYSDSGSMKTGTGDEAESAQRYLKIAALPAVAAKGYVANVASDIEITEINSISAHTHEGQHGDVKDYNGNNTCPVYTKANVSLTVLASRDATPDEFEQSGKMTIEEPVTVSFTIDLHKLDEQGGVYRAFKNTSLRLFVVEETDDSWNIYHRRYGHGVGMSQRGAQTRAKAGQTYQQILTFYYPNTFFEALNISPPALKSPPDTENASVINCKTAVNLRSTPDTTKSAIGSAPLGARLTVTQAFATPEWHKIRNEGKDAYIYAYYVKLDDTTASPSPSPTETPTVTPTETPAESPTAIPSAEPTETAATPTASPTATPTGTANASVVNCIAVNVRSTPDTTKAALSSVPAGTRITVTQPYATPSWHKISHNGASAYINAYYVKLDAQPTASPSPSQTASPTLSPSPSPKPSTTLPKVQTTGTVTSSTLNVRSGPGTSYSKSGVLTKGSKVDITKANYSSSWHQIIYKGKLAYVHRSYIKLSPNTQDGGNSGAAYASVTANRVNLRASASTSAKVYATLSRGDVVQVLGKSGSWYKVKYGGREGYMYASYLKTISSARGEITISSLNVRSAPSSSAKSLGKLNKGTLVIIVEKGGSWHRIIYGSGTAYVYASYIKLL